MSGRYEILTEAHLAEFGLEELPQWQKDSLTGWAIFVDGELRAVGGIIILNEHTGYGLYEARGPVPRAVHRRALELMRSVSLAGLTRVLAVLDDTKPRAREWMVRLGFDLTGDVDEDGYTIWRLDLGSELSGQGGDGGRRGDLGIRHVPSGPVCQAGR